MRESFNGADGEIRVTLRANISIVSYRNAAVKAQKPVQWLATFLLSSILFLQNKNQKYCL